MRTTLDLDERVLAAARARAREHGITLGQAVSELALRAIEEATEGDALTRNGLILISATPGHVITDDMVREALAND